MFNHALMEIFVILFRKYENMPLKIKLKPDLKQELL